MHAVAFRNCFKAILSKCETEVEQAFLTKISSRKWVWGQSGAPVGLGAQPLVIGSGGEAPLKLKCFVFGLPTKWRNLPVWVFANRHLSLK